MYLKLFVKSILSLGKYDASFLKLGQNPEELYSIFEQNKFAYSHEPLSQFERLVLKSCKGYLRNIPKEHIAHAYHPICQGFNDAFDNSPNRERVI